MMTTGQWRGSGILPAPALSQLQVLLQQFRFLQLRDKQWCKNQQQALPMGCCPLPSDMLPGAELSPLEVGRGDTISLTLLAPPTPKHRHTMEHGATPVQLLWLRSPCHGKDSCEEGAIMAPPPSQHPQLVLQTHSPQQYYWEVCMAVYLPFRLLYNSVPMTCSRSQCTNSRIRDPNNSPFPPL